MKSDGLERRMRLRIVPKDEEGTVIRANDPLIKERLEGFERDRKDIQENYPLTARFHAEEAKRRFEKTMKPREPLTPEEEQRQNERFMWMLKKRLSKYRS